MRENVNVRQIPGDRRRRWFSSHDFDLIVWFNDDGTFAGFELYYDKTGIERCFAWRPTAGFAHMTVDDGEQRPGPYKSSPILVPDGRFDVHRIYSAFAKESHSLPEDVATYVLRTLEQHASFPDTPAP